MPTSPDRIMDTIKRPKIGVGNIFEYSVCSKGRRFPVTLQMVRKPPVTIERMPMNPWGRNLLGREAQFRDVQAVAFFLGTTIAALPAPTEARNLTFESGTSFNHSPSMLAYTTLGAFGAVTQYFWQVQ